MRTLFKPVQIFRLLTLVVLSMIPARYFPEFLAVSALPLLTILAIFCGVLAAKTGIRLPVLVLLSFSFTMLFLGLSTLSAYLLPFSCIHRFFLHIRVVYYPLSLFFTALLSSTVAFLRYSRWRRIEPLLIILIGASFFWPQGNHNLTLFDHPYHAAIAVIMFILLVTGILFFSETTIKKPLVMLLSLIPLFLVFGTLFLAYYNTQSAASSGGLIRPTLFRFDFSPFLSLQNEISLNNNLVCIVHVPKQYNRNFLRRVYLSGWDPEKGFYEKPVPGDSTQITTVPGTTVQIPAHTYLLREEATQEVFIVNFDPDALIAMDYPVEITPYALWDKTSFNGAYSVTSQTSGFIPFELYESPFPLPGVDLPQETFSAYTEIDSSTKTMLETLINSITGKFTGYYDIILLLNEFLRNGEFRYSLKPGQSTTGNQLHHFLFDSRKGYCTYFAFSLCLMLRAKGIPSRVAAGFFLDDEASALDYYAVRSNMAHAWVEVFFPDYGWMAFDPTTTQIAPGEELLLSESAEGDNFTSLLKEIIDNRAFLHESGPSEAVVSNSRQSYSLRQILPKLLPALLSFAILFPLILLASIRLAEYRILRFSKSPRTIILLCAKRVRRRLGKQMGAECSLDTTALINQLFDLEKKARFAPECTSEDVATALNLEAKLTRKNLQIRLFGFFLFLLVFSLNAPRLEAQTAAQDLLVRAESAIAAENWERAITFLTQGRVLYPKDPLFPYTLGTIYEQEQLYEPAKNEYKTALSLGLSGIPDIFEHLSTCHGFLNEDEQALDYLRIYLELKPDDLYAWSNFGWLCYKTNKLEEGITTLHSIIGNYGPDGNLYAGLGNLYTASFNYTSAKEYYTKAITYARDNKQNFLGSIYLYNRSILEEVFFNFDEAYDDTTRSLNAASRSSGYLMQGELELRRLEFSAALSRYQKAYSLDSTPLASLGLADTLIQAGYVEKAEPYLSTISKRKDLSWIANYGTTPEQFRADIHRIQRDRYTMLKNRESRKLVNSFSTRVTKWMHLVRYSIAQWYHDSLFRIHSNHVAAFYVSGENPLYYNSFFFTSYDSWPHIARKYLEKAMSQEVPLIPRSSASYHYETARMNRDAQGYVTSMRTLHPVWEKNYMAKAVSGYVSLQGTEEMEKNADMFLYLYSLQPAAFLLENLSVPVQYVFHGLSKTEQRIVRRSLRTAGLREMSRTPFTLYIDNTQEELILRIVNPQQLTIYSQVIHKSNVFMHDCASLLNNFTETFYRSNLGI